MYRISKKIYIRSKSLKAKTLDLLFGDREYKKFVIISDSRTGSTLLMQLLDSHPNIIALGEEFKNLNGKSCKEIWKIIFRKRPRKLKWMGFKLFYFHPTIGNDKEVWDYLKKDKNIVIIHLIRHNILRSFVSKQIGLQTRKWTENINRPHGLEIQQKRVKLKKEECVQNFLEISNYIKQTNDMFKDHKIISVAYEDLNANKQEEMNRIFQELEVAPMEISTYMKKQNPEKLQDLISNYQELKIGFNRTNWAYLFE